jgi:hypothetical protein
MSVRRRGEAKQANGSANGSADGAIKHENVVDLKTDHTRWRMKNDDGRQTWHYLESDEELTAWPMTSADKYYLGMDTVGCSITNFTSQHGLTIHTGRTTTFKGHDSSTSCRKWPGVLLATPT